MNKKGLGKPISTHYSLFKEKFWREKEEEQRRFEEILNQHEREIERRQILHRFRGRKI